MSAVTDYPMTHQGVRNLDRPRRDHQLSNRSQQVNVGQTERTVSTIAGAALTGFGLLRGNFWGLLLAAGGASLIYRGLTGHCSAYSAAGIDTAR